MIAPTPNDPTLWELHRALQQLREDLRSDFAAFASQLEKMVTKDVYQADQRAVQQRLEILERQQDAEAAARTINRRLAVSAFIAPVLVAVVTVWLTSRSGP
ncbi:hypothetical protein OHS70_34285 [Streptomyces sp. NBC_00390]|uniref:hypothetical protein n=1 Tax=Streptomyces sp. NBC_00390 TaxID=2975736 RepID=UPI002E2119D6